MMNKKAKKILVSGIALAFVGCLTYGMANLDPTMAFADTPSVSATHIYTGGSPGKDWYSLYGRDGYVLFGDGGLYSDMYKDSSVDPLACEKGAIKNGYYNYTLDESAPISQWGTNAVDFCGSKSGTATDNFKLYAPGTTESVKGSRTGTSNRKYNDSSVYFTLKDDAPIYVTVNLYDFNYGYSYSIQSDATQGISATNPINNKVYNTAVTGYNVDTEVDEFYGSTALATATITEHSTYVTFKLEGAGDYQIVAYANEFNGGNANVFPHWGGFFFDETHYDPSGVVSAQGVDYTTRGDWTDSYGTDAYLVFGGEYDGTKTGVDRTVPIAYTKGLYNNVSGDPITGTVKYNRSDVVNKSGSTLAFATNDNSVLNNEIITKYSFRATNWDCRETKGWGGKDFGDQLVKPDNSGVVEARMGGATAAVGDFAFTLADSLFESYKYVDISFYTPFMVQTKYKNPEAHTLKFTTGVYPTYQAHNSVNEMCKYVLKGAPIATQEIVYNVEAGKNGQYITGYYSTFRFTRGGDYTVATMWDTSAENFYNGEANNGIRDGSISGVFFDFGPVAEKYTITYNGVGGETGVSIPQDAITQYMVGTTESLPAATKTYSSFIGWFDAAEGGNQVVLSPTTTGNLNLYPRFNYTQWNVNFDFGGVSVYSDSAKENVLTSQKFNYFEAVTFPTELYFEEEGYELLGWYEDEDFTGEAITGFEEGLYSSDQTFYAKLQKTSKITYVLNGGANAATNPTTYVEGSSVTFADATKEGYTFDGWYDAAEGGNKVTSLVAATTGDITLYARFTEIPVDSDSDSTEQPDDDNSGSTEQPGDDNSTSEVEPPVDDAPTSDEGGCNGSIEVGMVGLFALVIVLAFVAKKKMRN